MSPTGARQGRGAGCRGGEKYLSEPRVEGRRDAMSPSFLRDNYFDELDRRRSASFTFLQTELVGKRLFLSAGSRDVYETQHADAIPGTILDVTKGETTAHVQLDIGGGRSSPHQSPTRLSTI